MFTPFNRLLRQGFYLFLAFFAIVAVYACNAPFAQAEVDCATLPHWSNTTPAINLTHVFCGEFKNGRPKGYHSSPDGVDPDTIGDLEITQDPNAKGLYGVRWSYVGHPSAAKFSSMFPDSCSLEQVQASIFYAATNLGTCPAGAPNWSECGKNQPSTGNLDRYCSADDGSLFAIAMGLFDDGDVNTAFPLIGR